MMRRALRAAAASLALLVCAAPASAYQVVDPHVYVDGERLTQSILNPPLQTLYSVLNGGIDNTNVGAAGFFASQIIPTSPTAATFGGQVGYTFSSSGAPGQVPLSVVGGSSQTADLFDVSMNGTKVLYTDAAGTSHIAGLALTGQLTAPSFSASVADIPQVFFATSGTNPSLVPTIGYDQAPGPGLNYMTPAGTTYNERHFVNQAGTPIATAQLDPAGRWLTRSDIHAGFSDGASFFGAGATLGGGTYAAAANIPGGATVGSLTNSGTAVTAGTETHNGVNNFNASVAMGSTLSVAQTATFNGGSIHNNQTIFNGQTSLNGSTTVANGTPLASYVNQQAAYAVGSEVDSFARFSASGTFSLGAVPPGTWTVVMEADADPSSGVTISVTGSGASCEAPYTATAVGAPTHLNLGCTATTGQNPTVTLNFSGSPSGPTGIPPSVRFVARRVS